MSSSPSASPDRKSQSRSCEFVAIAWTVTAAFGTYFCMYGFRKPFTAAEFNGSIIWGVDLKSLLVTSQMLGYMLSKFIGIKVIPEVRRRQRVGMIIAFIGFAEVALILFGFASHPWNCVCLFFNGLALGMVYGVVLGFLEGRYVTEALIAGLCVSFIVADGFSKSIGAWLLTRGVSEVWMPSLAGLIFAGPLLVAVAMLARISPPSQFDLDSRNVRPTLSRRERWALFGRYATGISLLCVVFLIVTILRSLRADFAPQLWRGLGLEAVPATFTQSELYVALGVLIINGCTVFILDNQKAFFVSLGTCLAGFLLLGVALLKWQAGQSSPFEFMVCSGLGLYLPYVAVHTTIFERMLAMTRERGNLGFLMYLADSVGYLGYVVLLLARNVLHHNGDMLGLFITICWIAMILSLGCLLITWWYFSVRCVRAVPNPVSDPA